MKTKLTGTTIEGRDAQIIVGLAIFGAATIMSSLIVSTCKVFVKIDEIVKTKKEQYKSKKERKL